MPPQSSAGGPQQGGMQPQPGQQMMIQQGGQGQPGPHMMGPGGQRMQMRPGMGPMQPQQRFRMQSVRGPMPNSPAGEPLRPHFPPQQPMVMRMPITTGGHPMQMAGQIQVRFFSKIKLSLVISTNFELSRQKLDTKLLENG